MYKYQDHEKCLCPGDITRRQSVEGLGDNYRHSIYSTKDDYHSSGGRSISRPNFLSLTEALVAQHLGCLGRAR